MPLCKDHFIAPFCMINAVENTVIINNIEISIIFEFVLPMLPDVRDWEWIRVRISRSLVKDST